MNIRVQILLGSLWVGCLGLLAVAPIPAQPQAAALPTSDPAALVISGQQAFERLDYRQAEQVWQQALGYYRQQSDAMGIRETVLKLSQALIGLAEYPRAEAFARDGLEMALAANDRQAEGLAYLNLGMIERYRGNTVVAVASLEKSLAAAKATGGKRLEAQALLSLGNTFQDRGQWTKAIALYEQAVTLALGTGDRSTERVAYNNLARCYWLKGEFERTRQYAERNLRASRTQGDRVQEGWALVTLGLLAETQNEFDRALPLYRQGLALFTQTGDRDGQANVYEYLARTARESGALGEAETYSERGLALVRSLGRKGNEATHLFVAGDLAFAQGQYDRAFGHYQEALAIVRAPGSSNDQLAGRLLNQMGSIYEQKGQLLEARARYRQARDADARNGIAANNFIRVGRRMAEQLLEENRDEADRYCQAAGQQATAYTTTQCALTLLQTANPAGALTFAEQGRKLAQTKAEQAYTAYILGTVFSALDRTGEAQRVFSEALALKPPHSLEADLHLALGLLRADPASLATARRLDPTIAQVSSVTDLGGRDRQFKLPVPGEKGRETAFQNAYVPPIYRRLLINGAPVLMLIDTGAAYTLLNAEDRARTDVKPTGEGLLVAYADGRRERLVRYRPETVEVAGAKTRRLQAGWVLGGSGRDSLLGRDLLRQIMPPAWFVQLRSH